MSLDRSIHASLLLCFIARILVAYWSVQLQDSVFSSRKELIRSEVSRVSTPYLCLSSTKGVLVLCDLNSKSALDKEKREVHRTSASDNDRDLDPTPQARLARS